MIFFIIALGAGGLFAIQGVVNAELGKRFEHPLQASFISFLVALIFIVICLLILRPVIPPLSELKNISPINFTGGIYGVVYVTTILFLAPKLGIANTLVATIAGQLILSVIFDHFGLFGLVQRSVNIYRIIGCAGFLISLYFIQKK